MTFLSKKSQFLNKKIKNLKEGDKFIFTYGDKDYEFYCHLFSDKLKIANFSVHESGSFLGRSMNVDKITNKYITVYDYNLFKVRSTYKIPINKIEMI